MFGKKKKPEIDKEQLELIKNAQKRVRQKKGLYVHFVIFLISSVFMILANTLLGIGKDFKILGLDWFVVIIVAWLFLLVYHFFNVFITSKFMGKDWEQHQLDTLVAKQKKRIEELQKEVEKKHPLPTEQSLNKSDVKKNSELTIIVAAGENDAIGKDNKLIWHLSNDLKRFKQLTSGHCIIMGRKTFESFPKPLPNRTHIVITRQNDYKVPEGIIVVHTLEDALDAARKDKQPFIIGGGEIYKQTIDIADKVELTRVHHSFEGADTFFPKIDSEKWQEVSNTFHDKDDQHEFAFSFITYTRK